MPSHLFDIEKAQVSSSELCAKLQLNALFYVPPNGAWLLFE